MTFPPLPSPPTDNLYKFVALTGVILALGAPVYWASYTNAARQREAVAWEALREEVNIPFRDLAGPRSVPLDPAEAKAQEERLSKVRADSERKRKEFVAADTAYRASVRFLLAVNVLVIVGFVFGVVLAVQGFRLWYARVQRPQDLLLAQQAKDGADRQMAARRSAPVE